MPSTSGRSAAPVRPWAAAAASTAPYRSKAVESGEAFASGARAARGRPKPLFLVWKGYQRRAETLSAQLPAELVYFDHYFGSKLLRGLDYAAKLERTFALLASEPDRPVILQAPPVFGALACIANRRPYVLDVHNALFQSFWLNVPLTRLCVSKAEALIAHNSEAQRVLEKIFPGSRVLTLPDPLIAIRGTGRERAQKQVLAICSFDRDEPIDLIIDVVAAMPDYRFVITANPVRAGARRKELTALKNLTLTGFLSTDAYHRLLLSSSAAMVLTSMPAVQPSGACEALSSDTPLVISETALTTELFGSWAKLAPNDCQSIVTAIRSLPERTLDLRPHRSQWAMRVEAGMKDLRGVLAACA